jgi:hypothetical protein
VGTTQIEDAVPAPPYGGTGASAGAYLGVNGGDALSKLWRKWQSSAAAGAKQQREDQGSALV